MTLKYECYYCKKVFPAKDAIDGFEKGYKAGFLCPECGKNIQADSHAKQKVSAEQRKWAYLAFVLLLPTVFTTNSEIEYGIFEIAIGLNTLLFFSWLAFILILFAIKPSLFKETTLLTEPVSKA